MARGKDKATQWARLKRECMTFLGRIYGEAEKKIVVFGHGDINAALMVIAEAPGEQETLQQHPFVEYAGKTLDELICALHVDREALYITNVVKFRPTRRNMQTLRLSNRPPNREEILLCIPYLREEIALVQPDLIVTLGNTALRAVSGEDKASIGQSHGVLMPLQSGGLLFPLYHPASVTHNRGLRELYLEDLSKLKQINL